MKIALAAAHFHGFGVTRQVSWNTVEKVGIELIATTKRARREFFNTLGSPANFRFTALPEVQRRCVGMGGASVPRFLLSTRSLSQSTTTLSAAVLAFMSSLPRSSTCL